MGDRFDKVGAEKDGVGVWGQQGLEVGQGLPPTQAAGLRRSGVRGEIGVEHIDVEGDVDLAGEGFEVSKKLVVGVGIAGEVVGEVGFDVGV